MDKSDAVVQVKKACQGIALELMKIHPAAGALEDKEIKDEIYKALYELTKNLEMIKKLMRKQELKLAGENPGDVPPVL